MRSLTNLLGGRSTDAGESSQRTRRTGRRSRRSGAGPSTCDAAEGSGTAAGRRAGRRSRRGAPLVEEEAEEQEASAEEEEDQDQEHEHEQEEGGRGGGGGLGHTCRLAARPLEAPGSSDTFPFDTFKITIDTNIISQ